MSSLFDINLKQIKAFAHSKPDSEKEPFYEHCERTLKYYDKILQQFEIKDILSNLFEDVGVPCEKGQIFLKNMVLFHDIGKLTNNFQNKLDGYKNDETHSDKSFFALTHELLRQQKTGTISNKEFFVFFLLIYVVYKHHGNLNNIIEDISNIKFDPKKSKVEELSKMSGYSFENDIVELMKNDKFWERWAFSDAKELFREISKDSLSFFILIKLCYSLLITSDYYATLEYNNGKEQEIKQINKELSRKISDCFHKQEKINDEFNFNVKINIQRENLKQLKLSGAEKLNQIRSKLNVEAEENLSRKLDSSDNRVFFLNVPTGGGKTNLSMRLALKIMEKKAVKKLFYVFPFINIIEQSYNSLKKYIGEDNLTRLDSRFIPEERKDEYSKESLFADHVDNLFFNKPVLFTSHVKFFDLFFRNDKNSNYNFFQLANSVVVIDEIQAYKDTVWTEISKVLKSFGELMNTHFIVMSATLPELGRLTNSDFSYLFNEDFTNDLFSHELFKRTEIEPIQTKKDKLSGKVLDCVKEEKNKILVVFNKVKDSKEFFERITTDKKFANYKKYLLNSTILDEKRKAILAKCQEDGKKIILVSTQSIEAGVDIDFDIGFRAYSPWDSIVQVAGRINRNNRKPTCKLYVFKDDDYKTIYRGDVKSDITAKKEGDFFKMEKPDNEAELIQNFYKEIIESINRDNETPFLKNSTGNISDIRNLFLKIVDREIHLIEGDTVSLFIPLNEEAEKRWDDYVELFKGDSTFEKLIEIRNFRKLLAPYSLNIFNSYTKKGKVSSLVKDQMLYGYFYCSSWKKYYSEEGGLNVDEFKKTLTERDFEII